MMTVHGFNREMLLLVLVLLFGLISYTLSAAALVMEYGTGLLPLAIVLPIIAAGAGWRLAGRDQRR